MFSPSRTVGEVRDFCQNSPTFENLWEGLFPHLTPPRSGGDFGQILGPSGGRGGELKNPENSHYFMFFFSKFVFFGKIFLPDKILFFVQVFLAIWIISLESWKIDLGRFGEQSNPLSNFFDVVTKSFIYFPNFEHPTRLY